MRGTRELFPSSDAGSETSLYVAWLFTPEEWDVRLGPGRPDALPYFPSRARFEESQRGGRVEFDAVDLFCGVLYCWFELLAPEGCNDPEVRRGFLGRLLEDLKAEVGCPALDRLVVDAASVRRNDYGLRASVSMLMAGRALRSGSVPICSDLISDLWLLLEESDEAEIVPICQSIVEAYQGIGTERLGALRPDFAEQVVYIYVAALHLLGCRGAFNHHFRQVAQSLVSNPILMNRLWRIARGEPLGFAELQVFTPRRLANPAKVPAEEVRERT